MTPRHTRVYIAGPISADPLGGTRNAIMAGTALLERGFAPFVPHLSSFWQIVAPQSYETWMELDFAWVAVCDAVLRLPGVSPGADREVTHAEKLGIPVFYSLDSLVAGINALTIE